MTRRRAVRKIARWWESVLVRRHLCRLPAYRKAVSAERDAILRGCTRGVHVAREAKRRALENDLRGMA